MILYVGNLSFKATNQDLLGLFENFGRVRSAKVIEDWLTGRSRGFAFVEMEDREQAQNAILEYNGKDLLGRAMKVVEANSQNRDRPQDARFRGGYVRNGDERRSDFGGHSW